ncbi:MAG: hypothetical protein ACLUGQ_10235 [Coprococcus sp.]
MALPVITMAEVHLTVRLITGVKNLAANPAEAPDECHAEHTDAMQIVRQDDADALDRSGNR